MVRFRLLRWATCSRSTSPPSTCARAQTDRQLRSPPVGRPACTRSWLRDRITNALIAAGPKTRRITVGQNSKPSVTDHGTGGERRAATPRRRTSLPGCSSVATSSDAGRRPETRHDLNGCEHPRRPSRPPSARAHFVGLQLGHREACTYLPWLNRRHTAPAGSSQRADGVPGQPFDSGDRR